MSKELRPIISIFAFVTFMVMGLIMGQQNRQANPSVSFFVNKAFAQASVTPNSPVDSAAIDTQTDSQNTLPLVSPVATSEPQGESQLLSTTEEPKKPFYQDIRYIILLVDTVIVVALVMTLIIRLTSNLFSTSAPDPILTKNQKDQGAVTIDQLDVDIPL